MSSSPRVHVTAYRFLAWNGLRKRSATLRRSATKLSLDGTVVLSPEGFHVSLAGVRAAIDAFLRVLLADQTRSQLTPLETFAAEKREPLAIDIRPTLVDLGCPQVPSQTPSNGDETFSVHPSQVHGEMQSGCVLLDVRDALDLRVGRFPQALALGAELPHAELPHAELPHAFVDLACQLPHSLRDRPVVTVCTDGMRSEKAAAILRARGFCSARHLDGGILNYLAGSDTRYFEGVCAVPDSRIAVDRHRNQTAVVRCFHCRSPLTAADQESEKYRPHRHCPWCFDTASADQQQRIARRHHVLAEVTRPLPGSRPYTNRRPIRVPPDWQEGPLLDFLDSAFPFVGRNAWQRRADGGFLFRDGIAIASATIIRGRDELEHRFPDTVEADVNVDIEVLFEDDALIALNKPAPLPMHPCGRFNRNTLMSILKRAYYPQHLRPVHRLDANTSGLVIVCRNRAAARHVHSQFKARRVEKKYVARVLGHPPDEHFDCDAPISATATATGARATEPQGQAARTEFSVIARRSDGTTLLEARPKTGRTNQIRLHLWHLGLPICGDMTYLPDGGMAENQTLSVDSPPMCLHAHWLRFSHPNSGLAVTFEARLPAWVTDTSSDAELPDVGRT